MTPEQLEKKLEESVQNFNAEIQFMLDTFDQSHQDENLTKQDMEKLGQHTFYALNDFKANIVEYIKNNR